MYKAMYNYLTDLGIKFVPLDPQQAIEIEQFIQDILPTLNHIASYNPNYSTEECVDLLVSAIKRHSLLYLDTVGLKIDRSRIVMTGNELQDTIVFYEAVLHAAFKQWGVE